MIRLYHSQKFVLTVEVLKYTSVIIMKDLQKKAAAKCDGLTKYKLILERFL
jgi:hypothetical protein